MKKKIRLFAVLLVVIASVCGFSMSVSAAEGWNKSGSTYTYVSESGKKLTGWQTIGDYRYYFSQKGVLQTGWKKISGKYYYFEKTGSAGKIGRMAVGFKQIGKSRYLFKEDGTVTVGWKDYNNRRFFFSNSKKLGVRGRAITGWKTIGTAKYYFNSYGVMQKSKWISGKYYVGEDGKMLKSTVTPDGYVVNSKGVKTRVAKGWIKVNGYNYYYVSGKMAVSCWKTISGYKYYFDENGKRLKGWQTIDGVKYHFGSTGKLSVNTTVDGVKLGSDGKIVEDDDEMEDADSSTTSGTTNNGGSGKKILIISGHGQGDVGATAKYGSTTYYEYKFTREFAKLIYNKLSGSSLNVTLYDQRYDLYQVNAGKKTGPMPKLTDYDYVLEIHFNATVASSKDLSGDGSYKGVGMYIHSGKSNYTIDKKIVNAIVATGFTAWGGGIHKTDGLLNAKTCQKKGVSYGLLETAFIDDKDDMKFYNKNKNAMAQAAATAILNYFK